MTAPWVPATLVDARMETPWSRTLVLDAPEARPSLAGQSIDVRLTAEDGYTAQRSYSLASPAGTRPIEITVDKIADGEVSPYLVDQLGVGHMIEVRGPGGRFFTWTPDLPDPVLLVAGGSGVVPLMAMIRTREAAGGTAPMQLLYSVRTPEGLFYRDELDELAARGRIDVRYVFTRTVPAGWPHQAGRITRELLADFAMLPEHDPLVYVCGPTGFVEAAATHLVRLGHNPLRIKTERFGPTG
ncbi:ferredoxin reductase [Naasia sp. SYSU D00948]|uniref:ferredoxin reductase n=1 Tax=Naasia sp. SYSU D00948 TaxID=2817379 RepID=UPI0027DB6D04|nr:ferredoxin reductase [Naasia sp. SYSU D00948]